MLVLVSDSHCFEESLDELQLVSLEVFVRVFSVDFEELEGANLEVHHLLLLRLVFVVSGLFDEHFGMSFVSLAVVHEKVLEIVSA